MASTRITARAGFETRALRDFGTRIAPTLGALVRALKAYGMWRDIRELESRARKEADTTQAWSIFARFNGVALKVADAITQELRIRRDTRQLMTMSDRMLKDIGLTRAEIGRAARYGRY